MTESNQSHQTTGPFSTSLEDLTRQLLLLIQKLTGMESAYLTRIDQSEQAQHLLYAHNAGQLQIPEGLTVPWQDTLCRRALEDGRFASSDVATAWPEVTAAQDLGIKSFVSVPVELFDGSLYGTLCAASSDRVEVGSELYAVLGLLAELITHRIEAESIVSMAEQRLTRVALLAEVGHLCLGASALMPAVEQCAELLSRMEPWRCAIVFQYRSGLPIVLSADNQPRTELIQSAIEAFGNRITRRHDEQNQPLMDQASVTDSVRRQRQSLGYTADGPTALLTAATISGLEAGILLLADHGHGLEARDGQMLSGCSDFLSMLADRLFHQGVLEASNRDLSLQASRDALTGLPNRRSLIETLQRTLDSATRNKQHVYVAFIDLDGFKKINDQHGHEAGDLFLISIARKLQTGLRADDFVARLGGDEFVVVSATGAGRKTSDVGRHLAERIDHATTGEHDLGSARIDYAGASIGIVSWNGESIDELIKRADQAMYEIKKRRSGRQPESPGND
jgi:diguanylate cyclase (GGDEF)-like protein